MEIYFERDGGPANEKFKSKIKEKDVENTFEWWKKQKNSINKNKKKHKKKKKKIKPTTTTTTVTTITTTAKPAPVTTWFPTSKETTTNYFTRPLDYQKPIKTAWWNKKGIYNLS